MLEAVEVLDGARRAVRRATHTRCEVFSDHWDRPVALRATDVSELGLWVSTALPLPVGEEVIVSFRPPHLSEGPDLVLCGTVRRSESPRVGPAAPEPGMGIEFLDVPERESTDMRASLTGLPPHLPAGRSAHMGAELVWVDMLLTWEEDLGDRVNYYEVSERVGLIADEDLLIEPLGELLTGSGGITRAA